MGTALSWSEACRRLDLSPRAGRDDIIARYRVLANRLHPDRFFTPAEKLAATKRFQDVTEAYQFCRSQQFTSREPIPAASHPVARPDGQRSTWTSPRASELDGYDLLESLENRAPALHFLLDLLFAFVIPGYAIGLFPVILLDDFLNNYPLAQSALRWIALKLAPYVITILIGLAGIARGHWWAWLFVAAGGVYLLLEFAAQAISWKRLGAASRQLAITLSGLDSAGRPEKAG